MSEEKRSFMEELDTWTRTTVIVPLYEAFKEGSEEFDQGRFAEVQKAIRQKVLESYRNGQAAGPSRAPREAYKPRGRQK